MIEFTTPAFVNHFFQAKLGMHISDDFRGVLYVPPEFAGPTMDMARVAIGVGYNTFVGRTCCMHTVIQRPDLVSRRIVREAFEFPFLVANCTAVIAPVDSANEAALSLDTRLGFHELARIPNGGPDADLLLLIMYRDECRWLRPH